MKHQFFATCPRGLEELLGDDLAAAGGRQVKAVHGGASCSGDLATAYRINLESRIACVTTELPFTPDYRQAAALTVMFCCPVGAPNSGSACGSTDEPKAAPGRPRRHAFGITRLPPQFLLVQRHRDTLGVIDRSAVIGGDREARHSRKRTHTRRRDAADASAPHGNTAADATIERP